MMDYKAFIQDLAETFDIQATESGRIISELWQRLARSDVECLAMLRQHTEVEMTFKNPLLSDEPAAEGEVQIGWSRQFHANPDGSKYQQVLTRSSEPTGSRTTNHTITGVSLKDIPEGYTLVTGPNTLPLPSHQKPEDLPCVKYHDAALESCQTLTHILYKTAMKLRDCERSESHESKTDASQKVHKLKEELHTLICYANGTLDSMMGIGKICLSHLQHLMGMPEDPLVSSDMELWKSKGNPRRRAQYQWHNENLLFNQLVTQKKITEMLAMCGNDVPSHKLVSRIELETALTNALHARAEMDRLKDDSSSAPVYPAGAILPQGSTSSTVPQRPDDNATIKLPLSSSASTLGRYQLERLPNATVRVRWVQDGRSQAVSDPRPLYALEYDIVTGKYVITSGASRLAVEFPIANDLKDGLGYEWLTRCHSDLRFISQVSDQHIRDHTAWHILNRTMAQFSQEAVELFSDTILAHTERRNTLVGQIFNLSKSITAQTLKERLAAHGSETYSLAALMSRYLSNVNVGILTARKVMEEAKEAFGGTVTETQASTFDERIIEAQELVNNIPNMVNARSKSNSSAASGEPPKA